MGDVRAAPVTIVDYGMGNLRSVRNAISFLGFESTVTSDPAAVRASAKLVLPGVGSFRRAMENIRQRGLDEALRAAVVDRGAPVLGICLGMQLLAGYGHEDGGAAGLGWIRGEVVPFRFEDKEVRIPHIGFNSAWTAAPGSRVFGPLERPTDFYFVHSFHVRCEDERDVALWCDYHGRFCAGVERGNVFGTQFHPEKSQANGLAVLHRFLGLPSC